MKHIFTKEELIVGKGCYSTEEANTVIEQLSNYSLEAILDSSIKIKDKFWFVRNNCELTNRQQQILALNCAKISLKFYTIKYPNDNRVSDCIQATEDYINGIITKEELVSKGKAAAYAADNAAAAYTAADDANAYAAAAAAYTASNAAAAYTAADDANAAYADADANAYAAANAYDGKHTKSLLQMLKDFCTNPDKIYTE